MTFLAERVYKQLRLWSETTETMRSNRKRKVRERHDIKRGQTIRFGGREAREEALNCTDGMVDEVNSLSEPGL